MTENEQEARPADANSTPVDENEALVAPDVPESDPSEPLRAKSGGSRKRPSAISGAKFRKRDLVKIDDLRPSLAERIRSDFPDLPPGAKISRPELARYRMIYVEEILEREHG